MRTLKRRFREKYFSRSVHYGVEVQATRELKNEAPSPTKTLCSRNTFLDDLKRYMKHTDQFFSVNTKSCKKI
jgi:hypothetical protein